MIITKTPFRMSFFGGGTDMEDYFRENGGAVLSATFDKYCYVQVRQLPKFFDYASELIYSRTERVKDVAAIEHPLIRNAMKMMELQDLRLAYDADLPARSGLGTSSSFAVGMLHAFYALKGQYVDKKRLADDAIYLERVLCAEAGGWQDQIAASFGGLNRIDFGEHGYTVHPLILNRERKRQLNDRLLMYFTGFTRLSSQVQKDAAGEKNGNKKAILGEMHRLVDAAQNVLTNAGGDLDEFGRLLHYTWQLKRQTSSKISTDAIDAMYEKGIKAGALGGKLLGAGSGGFLIFYVQPEKRQAVRQAMAEWLEIPFEFEENGTQVLYYRA